MVSLLDAFLQVRKVSISTKMNPTRTILIRAPKPWFVTTVVIRMRCYSCILVDDLFGLIGASLPSGLTFVSRMCSFSPNETLSLSTSDLIDVWRFHRGKSCRDHAKPFRWCLSFVIIGHLTRSRTASSSGRKYSDAHPCFAFASLWSSHRSFKLPMKQRFVRHIRIWLIITVIQFWKIFARGILQSFTSFILQ